MGHSSRPRSTRDPECGAAPGPPTVPPSTGGRGAEMFAVSPSTYSTRLGIFSPGCTSPNVFRQVWKLRKKIIIIVIIIIICV